MRSRSRRASFRLALKLGLVAAAALAAVLPLPSAVTDRFYANRAYPLLQGGLTSISNLIPFSIGDLLLLVLALGLPIWWILRINRSPGRRIRTTGLLAFNSLVLAAGIYLSFLALWGLNYQRAPLMVRLDYDESRLTDQAMGEFFRSTIQRLNSDSVRVHAEARQTDEELRHQLFASFTACVTELGNSGKMTAAVPKVSLSDPWLGATGVAGFTNPFGLEVILNSDLLPIERPFTLAHEWAHLAGFADESEANFIALLTCARSELPAIRYSGWLAIYPYLQPAKADRDRLAQGVKWNEILPALAEEVTDDLHSIVERSARRMSPTISRMQSQVYDGFLKANRVEAGIMSYGLFVRLVLGTRFESEWSPARQTQQ